ncbi:Tctex1 domain-containing protein 2 [Holothuria leucospilota]|uniref:Tctex1 domain-containing protein 2 n=1 Tax=Holothuria leucospilota TaxID=206669 RepID=A0A9Q1BRE2_HOLLE|nr:Tctex1 domain-containing protein 2 [Holothuria leucospilota]
MSEDVQDQSDTANPLADEQEENAPNTYMIRPNFAHKFRAAHVKEVVHTVLNEELAEKSYNAEETTALCKHLSNEIKGKLKELKLDRYKFVVQVVIGEQRGEGVKMGCKCFWDSDTDNCAQDIFMNDSMFCVAAVFGVFFY